MSTEELVPYDLSVPAPGVPVTCVRLPPGFEFKNSIPRSKRHTESMDVHAPDDPLDLAIDIGLLPVTGRDGYGEKTPTVRELIEILGKLPEKYQDLPVAVTSDEGIGTIRGFLGYGREERDPNPSTVKYTMHIRLL